MLAPLRCPTCSAPLTPTAPHARTLTCPYCGASVLLTERLGGVEAAAAEAHHNGAIAEVLGHLRAGRKIDAIRVYRERLGGGLKEAKDAVERLAAGQPAGTLPPGAARPRVRGMLVAALVAVAVGLFVVRRADEPARAVDQPVSLTPPGAVAGSPAPEEAAADAFAVPVLRFGSEGTGAGRFEDARAVAVDGAGRIYVAEYIGGRVQAFDSAGVFQTQWMADPEMPLLALAADRDGTVYAVQAGRLRRYAGATGEELPDVPRPGRGSYDDVTVALDGSLYAVVDDARVVHLSREGRVLQTIDLHEAVGPRATPVRVAVAGTGEVYVLDQWTQEVYRFDTDGRFVDRFGGRGDRPGNLSWAQDLAVDGRGRLYLSDIGAGVRVFEPDGQPVAAFGGGVVFGLALNDRDEVFAAHRNDHEVVKYRPTP